MWDLQSKTVFRESCAVCMHDPGSHADGGRCTHTKPHDCRCKRYVSPSALKKLRQEEAFWSKVGNYDD